MKRRAVRVAASVDSPYLTTAQCAAYIQRPSVRAFYEYLRRHPDFPRCAHTGLFDKRDVDAWMHGTYEPEAVSAHRRRVQERQSARTLAFVKG